MFIAYEISLQLVRAVRAPLERIEKRDADLGRQMRRAASSAALNIREGNRRVGKDRLHSFRVAAGSADEVVAALEVAREWGYVDAASVAPALAAADRLLGILWALTQRAQKSGNRRVAGADTSRKPDSGEEPDTERRRYQHGD